VVRDGVKGMDRGMKRGVLHIKEKYFLFSWKKVLDMLAFNY
jgi:hypothetical protein